MLRHRLFAAVLALALAGVVSESLAQAPEAAQQDEIVVEGRHTEDAIRAFVDEMAVAARGQDQLGRWDRRICPGVAGLRARYAQFVIDRMAQRAFDVGLDVGEPGCRANVLIVVSPDPGAVARDLFENHRDAMGYFDERGHTTLGRRALRAFVDSNAPVRWWHVSRTVTRDGDSVGDTADGGPTVSRLSGSASRLRRGTRQDFGSAFIIVDARQLTAIGYDFGALADYIAMAALAQLDPEADTTGYPSILNLFGAALESRPTQATDWDVAYLRGLYSATRDAASASRQEGEIARTIARDAQQP